MSEQSNHLKDENILAAIQSGNGKEISTIFRQLVNDPYLLQSVSKFIPGQLTKGDDQAAKRLLCDALAKFYEIADEGRFDTSQEAKVSTFIIAIAKKMRYTNARSDSRFEKRIDKATLQDPENPLLNDRIFDPEMDLIRQEKEEAMQKALQGLGERCHQILNMWSQRYSYEEIATVRHMAVNSVKGAIKSCRDKLHKYLMTHPELTKIILEK
ncbi:MAG: sigma-70 family RNA polymerase sigma factor [Bacteroidota bacterium]